MTIERLGIRLTATQRVSMGTGAGKAFHTTTHRHVPGSVWRGALAAAWIQRRGAPDPDFARIFDRDLRFGPLLADGTSMRPLSVRSCKYGPKHCPHPAYWDAAFPHTTEMLPLDWDSPAGHWVSGRGEVVGGLSHIVTSTAINPATGSAAERQLFSREALPARTVFTGVVTGEHEALDLLAKATTDLERLEVGGRSSVLGGARLELTDPPAPVSGAELAATRVVLRLTSPAFIVDAAGRPATAGGILSDLQRLGYRGSIASTADGVPKIWSRPLTDGTGGYHAATRMPKPTDIGIAAGTTVVLRPRPDDAEALARILDHGLGLRRPEGFGCLEIATRPWQMPEAPAGPVPDQEPEAGYGFVSILTRVKALGFTDAQRRWLIARLTEASGIAPAQRPEAVPALLAQPGASTLSDDKRVAVAEILTETAQEVLRRLADALRAETGR